MPLQINWSAKVVEITSPTTSVDAQTLHDFIEDQMASPRGLSESDIISPEGKIEDPSNPGVFSQIIIILNSPWQLQFWAGSGYTRIYGGKLVGGLNDQPFKATGTAGDITVLESPVDGLTVVSGSGVTAQDKTDIINGVLDGDLAAHQIAGTLSKAITDLLTQAGLTPEEATQLLEVHMMMGLRSGAPMTVTPTSRTAGSVSQTLSGDPDSSVTVERDP